MLADKYLEEYVKTNNTDKTFIEYKRYVEYLKPQIGRLKVSSIEEIHFLKIQTKAKEEKGERSSNIIITMLKKMFELAVEKWGILQVNPCKKIKKFKEMLRSQYNC